MPSTSEIVDYVKLLLDGRVSVNEFGDWMLGLTGSLMWNGGSDDARRLAYAIQSKMTEFDIERINEAKLRQELAATIRPYLV